jgi:hypothetical protein
VFGTTIVNVAEQMKGWLAVINKEREAPRQVAGHRELARLFEFYAAYLTTSVKACAICWS